MENIGFIGLGNMGAAIALNIREAGYPLVVHDLDRAAARPHLEAGADWAGTPKDVASRCETVFLSLPGPDEVRKVALEGPESLSEGIRPKSVIVDLTTNAPATVRALDRVFAERDCIFLDAPISGGARGAAKKRLAVWAGGDRAAFEARRPVLESFADNVGYIGESGAGTIAKLAHNAAGFAAMEVFAEVFSMGVKAGLPPLDLWRALRQGAMGRMRTFDMLAGAFLTGNYDSPSFTLDLARKDLGLARDFAEEMGLAVPMIAHTLARMDVAKERDWGARDAQSFLKLQLEEAGLEIGCDWADIRDILKG